MLSFTLFKRSLCSHWKTIAIFMGILAMYISVIIGMFDPKNIDIVEQLSAMKLSPELLSAFGFTLTDRSLLGFVSSYLYGMLLLAFPMICYIILSNALVCGLVDRGSMTCLLSTPCIRRKIIFTQGFFLVLSIAAIMFFSCVWGVIYSQMLFPDMLNIKGFILLNLGCFLVHFAMSGISFLSSCIFDDPRHSYLFGAGIPIVFLLLQMLSNVGEKLEFLKNFTPFSLFSPSDIISGSNIWLPFISMFIIGIILYGSGIFYFSKKDLHI